MQPVTYIDPGVQVSDRPYTPATRGWLDTAHTIATDHPALTAAAVIAVATAIVLALTAKLVSRLRRTTKPATITGGKLRKGLVYLAASIGSGFTIVSMWNVFEHKLHIDNIPVRIVLCAVFEVMMLASAVNSRAFRLKRAADANHDSTSTQRQEIDVDGIAVWVFAAVAGFVCFWDSTNPVEAIMRGFLPIAVAWMWERAIAADLRTFARTPRTRKINLRISTERILVALRIAEPTGRDVSDVEKARYRSVFTVAAYRLHTLLRDGAWPWRVGFARWRLRRAGLAIMKRFGAAELIAARRDVATLYGIEDYTSPESVEHLAGWRDRVTVTATTDASGAGETLTLPADAVTVTRTAATHAGDSDTTSPQTVTPATTAAKPSATVARRPTTVTNTTDGHVTVARVQPLSRDAIDAEFASWTAEQVEEYAGNRARAVAAETGNKTAGMREYFLVCLALGVEPKGTRMADAVGVSGGLGRGKAKEWHGELSVGDAEDVLRNALARVAEELANGGSGRD